VSEPSRSRYPFRSTGSRAAAIGFLIGVLGSVAAVVYLIGAITEASPGGEDAMAVAALPPTGPGWHRVLEVDLEAGKPVEVWEIQRHHTGGEESSFGLVFRTPGRQEVALEKRGSTTMQAGGVHSTYVGTLEPTTSGTHILEAEVRSVPRAAPPELAVHPAGTVGLPYAPFLICFIFLFLLGVSFVGVVLELGRWMLENPTS
jgi:hypothetical protein